MSPIAAEPSADRASWRCPAGELAVAGRSAATRGAVSTDAAASGGTATRSDEAANLMGNAQCNGAHRLLYRAVHYK